MTLIILDPNFAHPHGHHMEWDLGIAAAARDREQDVLIFAHRDCPLASKDGLEIVPLFSHSTYECKYKDRIVGKFDDFTYFNDTLANELSLIPRDRLRAADAVLVPTLTENHLLGYVSWMRTFDAARAPLFVLYLMFPSGLGIPNETGARTVADPFQALFYRLAFRRAAEPGPPIHFFGSGPQLAREFSELAGTPIEPHPIPVDPRSGNSRKGTGRPAALLFAGDAKADKGFTFMPELADRLCAIWPDWDFLIHVNLGSSSVPALEAYNELTMAVIPRHKNLLVQTGRLSREDYLEFIDRADCLVATYDPVVYARKSSGVIWEAISLGVPMLVPADTWLENEAREWAAGYRSYNDFSVDGIIESFSDFSQAVPTLRAQSVEAAERYQAYNGMGALMDQIGRLWAPRMLAASLVPQPRSSYIPLEDIGQEGWSFPETLNEHIVRWAAQSFEIGFSWPFDVPWQVDVEVARCSDEKQITLACAFAAERELRTRTNVHETGKSGNLTIFGAGDRHRPAVRVRVELPSAFSPPGETRELGLLVRSVQVSPGETAERNARTGQLEVFTSVTNTEAGGFLLDQVVSGRALMNPHADNWLHFTVRTNGGPEIARAVEVYVNGIPMRIDSFATGTNSWAMKVKCGPDILAATGYWADWDLVFRSGLESQVWIANLLVSESGETPALAGAGFEHQSLAADGSIRIPGANAFNSVEAHKQAQPSVSNGSDELHRQNREETLVTAKALSEGSEGFHTLEYSAKGSAFRWTGPGPESRFTLWINRTRPVVLTFRIISLGDNRPADLTVEVDGEIYPLREGNRSRATFAAGPLKARSGNGPTKATLRVSHLVRPSEGADDKRTLGVALAWIRAEIVEEA
jgi:hypothetical protein